MWCQACHSFKDGVPDQRRRDACRIQRVGGAQRACQHEQAKAHECLHLSPRCVASAVCVQQASPKSHVLHPQGSCGRHHTANDSAGFVQPPLDDPTTHRGRRVPMAPAMCTRTTKPSSHEPLLQVGKAVGDDDVIAVTETDEEELASLTPCSDCHNTAQVFVPE